MKKSPPAFRRSVFFMGGYEPKSSAAFFDRNRRELARFCQTWQVQAQMGQADGDSTGPITTAHIETQLPAGRVDTELNFLSWNDIVLSDFSRPTWLRVARYVLAFSDYVVSGTFFRIARQSWRFSLYFLYPAGMLLLFTGLAITLGLVLSQLPLPAAGWLGGLIAWGAWIGMLRWSDRRWFVLHLMDLWSFSHSHLRDQRADIEKRIDTCAQAIVDRALKRVDDEIVLVGHSTGGALILEVAAQALAKYPAMGTSGPTITVLTVGSTALKIGLHPAAANFRRRVQLLVDAEQLGWVECQAHTDVINFYKSDPVAAMQLNSQRPHDFPQVHVVRIREMLQPETYRRFKYNVFRIHYQYVMANTQRYTYDFFMMCCGDTSLLERMGDRLRYPSQRAA